MTTISLSKSYELAWRVSFAPHYQVSQQGIVFNVQTGKKLRRGIGEMIDPYQKERDTKARLYVDKCLNRMFLDLKPISLTL